MNKTTSLLSREFLIKNLRSLSPKRNDMLTLSVYIDINKSEYTDISEIYSREMEQSNIFHRLNLFYLANEIFNAVLPDDPLFIAINKIVDNYFVLSKEEAAEYKKLYAKYVELEEVWKMKNKKPKKSEKSSKAEFFDKVELFWDDKNELKKYLIWFVDSIETQ